jgi:hypothetical protein
LSQTCKGCREQQTNETLCLVCIEDLSFYLREIPLLFEELGSVRMPGSVSQRGPWTSRTNLIASPSPVRLEVVDMLDRGETLSRLLEWTDTGSDVTAICDGFRAHLLSTASEPWAGDFFRAMRNLCRDLGRAVGQPEEQPVGKCPEPVGDTDELCRGQLYRAEAGGVYCRRCGTKPEIIDQQVWVTAREASVIVGKPIETVRTWFKRGRVGWGPPMAPNLGWLPIIVRRAQLATVPPSGNLNHGSRAELSAASDGNVTARRSGATAWGSDADVLGRVAPGNVTLSEVATSGKAAAPDPSQDEQSPSFSLGPAGTVSARGSGSDSGDHLTAESGS